VSASPSALAQAFQGVVAEDALADSDLAIFAINPSAGIDSHTISLWHELDQFQIPRLVVVNGIEGQEQDFDDAVLVARRVLDDVITPYLVLHDEKGEPTALIRLQDLEIIDYSTSPPSQKHCDPEHEELVRDFREEYFEQTSEMDEGAFAAGIIFPAIPINLNKGIGVDVVLDYIKQLPSGS
jgi:translation elongation factor EF-G